MPIRVSRPSGGGAAAAPYVTSLPGSPANGDEVRWEIDGTNGVVWNMRYVSAVSKWRFLGGSALYVAVETSESTASTTYVDLTTAGPTIALPAAGLYACRMGAFPRNNTASVSALMGLSVDGGAPAASTEVLVSNSTVANAGTSSAREFRITAAAAGNVVAKYRASGGTGTFDRRWLSIQPIQL